MCVCVRACVFVLLGNKILMVAYVFFFFAFSIDTCLYLVISVLAVINVLLLLGKHHYNNSYAITTTTMFLLLLLLLLLSIEIQFTAMSKIVHKTVSVCYVVRLSVCC